MKTSTSRTILLLLMSFSLAACSPAQIPGEAQLARNQLQQKAQAVLQAAESRLPPQIASRLPGPGTAPDAATQTAIKQVIQKANSEQEQAIASHDSSVMKDTSTDGYYEQISQDNQDALDSGVTAIKLVKIDFGSIGMRGGTANATTFETWSTTYEDGTTDQETDRNLYTLVQQGGQWKIQRDEQPETGASVGPSGGSSGAASGRPGASVASTPPPSASPLTVSAPNGSPEAAIEQVILKGNSQQEQAIASHDTSALKDTATDNYYRDVSQATQDMVNNGISSIKLLSVEWGQVTVNGSNATASNFETWWTQYSDGSTDQLRDRNVYTLVQQNGSWKIDSDEHPDSGLSPAPGSSGAPSPQASGSTAPTPAVPPASAAPAGRGSSINWAGYAANSGTFTAVSATWTVPQISGTGSVGADAAWVGIGGEKSRDLLQAGTQETILNSGRTEYNAWIEMLPQFSHPVPLGVHAGDSVSVSIQEQGNNNWQVSFTNNTTGSTYQKTVQYASSHSSAEWIEEAPSGGRGGVLPLDNFGSITFSSASAVKDGKTVNLTQADASPITMINGSRQPVATTSQITPDGAGFTVTRTANSSGRSSRGGRGASS